MPKFDIESALIYIAFVILIIIAIIISAFKVTETFKANSQVSLYSRPSWYEEETSDTSEETSEETESDETAETDEEYTDEEYSDEEYTE